MLLLISSASSTCHSQLINMNSQLNASTSFKRFANASEADIAKIREDRHALRTKNATKWATNVFQGK